MTQVEALSVAWATRDLLEFLPNCAVAWALWRIGSVLRVLAGRVAP